MKPKQQKTHRQEIIDCVITKEEAVSAIETLNPRYSGSIKNALTDTNV